MNDVEDSMNSAGRGVFFRATAFPITRNPEDVRPQRIQGDSLTGKEVRNLRQQLNYRILTPAQSATISGELRSLPQRKVQIICPLENQEAYEYAKQLSRVLEAAHWDTRAGILRQPKLGADFGITIIGREDVREGVQSLLYVLSQASVPSSMRITPVALAGHIQIFVGPKP